MEPGLLLADPGTSKSTHTANPLLSFPVACGRPSCKLPNETIELEEQDLTELILHRKSHEHGNRHTVFKHHRPASKRKVLDKFFSKSVRKV
jgi:hypothetical protein